MPKIKSVKSLGIQKVRDLEVDHLDHQFYLANGVLTSNSHAVAYSIISYQCAYLAYHYAPEWACAYLNEQKPQKLSKAVSDVQKAGYRIEMVNVNKSAIRWEPISDKIIAQPMGAIKGLPTKAMATILANRPIKDLTKMFFGFPKGDINKKAKKVLTQTGALDELIEADKRISYPRQIMRVFEEIKKPFKNMEEFYDAIDNMGEVEDFTYEQKIDNIFLLTGLFPSAKIVSDVLLKRFADESVISFSDFKLLLAQMELDPDFEEHNYKKVDFWFIVKGYEIKKASSGKPYCQITATDDEGMEMNIRTWNTSQSNAEQKLDKYHVYIAELDYNKYGLSRVGLRKFEQIT